ncbi:MAG: hypothetical protein H6828_10820 [Planctomycetes bacterium]|nr:hypothetical protein [Planctomycetota bacterium]
MSTPLRPVVPALAARAEEDLRYIRAVLVSSGRFTAVPGWGAVYMGCVALAAAAVAARCERAEAWLLTWVAAAACAVPGGLLALTRKARALDLPLVSGVGRKFLLGLCPALFVGLVLSVVLHDAGLDALLPLTWLLLYGAAVLAAGAHSIAVVPLMGACFLALGLVAACVPATWGTPLLAAGFGGLHLGFGAWVVRRHGG